MIGILIPNADINAFLGAPLRLPLRGCRDRNGEFRCGLFSIGLWVRLIHTAPDLFLGLARGVAVTTNCIGSSQDRVPFLPGATPAAIEGPPGGRGLPPARSWQRSDFSRRRAANIASCPVEKTICSSLAYATTETSDNAFPKILRVNIPMKHLIHVDERQLDLF